MPSLRVLGISFEVTTPYVEGPHELTRSEAAELNKLRIERIGRLARKRISTARQRGQSDPTPDELSALAATFAFSLAAYAPPADPLAAEALKIARSLARTSLARRGQSPDALAPEAFAALVSEIASSEAVQTEAARRLSATRAITQSALFGDLDLG